MRKSLVLDPDVQKHLRALPKEQCVDVVLTLLKLADAFGKPHVHSGLGIRKLRSDLFECRVDLSLRILFRASEDGIILRFIGNHDEVRKYLRAI